MVSFALSGVGVSGGIAIGRAQLVSHATIEVAHYSLPASKIEGEIARFSNAVKEVQTELEGLHLSLTGGDVPGEFGAFLDVHWMILTDPTLSEAPKRLIAEQRCNAEWALTQQLGVLVEQFEQIEDPYLRERKADMLPMGLATDSLQQLFARTEGPWQALRNWGMKGFERSGPLKEWMARQAMGTH